MSRYPIKLREISDYLELSRSELTFRMLPEYCEGYIDFSSNDYLGLSKDTRVIEAGIEAAQKYGAGATGSRLLSGNFELFDAFEKQIAKDKGTEDALIFNSGYHSNAGILECLADKKTLVIFDKLNHASMYQGVFASGAKLLRFHHLDYENLEELLQQNVNSFPKIIVVSETVFGMDGDIADVATLSKLSHQYGALLYLDEAHATGLYGINGYGISTLFELDKSQTIIMGTLSKALGGLGGYVACSSMIKSFLLQKCKSFIYSTALSPFCVGAAAKSWEIIRTLDDARAELLRRAQDLREKLGGAGKGTNIIPVLFEHTADMLMKRGELQGAGIIVSAIRRPTSPTPRLRIALSTRHSDEDVAKLLEAFGI
ncbi:MAG: 8-amino-7-oxononanoate synthase [Alphaproteobacteria bacterium]|nr:8-amino-7-oxononanoate synthase [Alphaproteobacteria bacterium]